MTAYPQEIVDPHHHFIDTSFNSFLRSVAGDDSYYSPDDYQQDVIDPIENNKLGGIQFYGTVHVECMPDDGLEEVKWVNQLSNASFVKGIVASCDLTQTTVREQLQQLATQPNVKGIRWILDCVGPYQQGTTATHVATLRHNDNGQDYLQSPDFHRGLGLLQDYNLSFDLQCAPIQLVESAASLFAKYPKLKVCIDHLGKPRKLLGDDLDASGNVNPNTTLDEKELATWRQGMKAMALLPNVYVKLSMLGYCIPGWIRTLERKALVKSLVRETVDLFGPQRCMVAWNWYTNGAASDADGLSTVGPDAVELLELFMWFFEDYSKEDRARLFAGTAKEFYRL